MSDRYSFIKKWTDPQSGKTFDVGNVFRTSPGDAQPLIDGGFITQVAEGTMCRKNPLAPNSCQPVTEEQEAAYKLVHKQKK